MKRRGFTLAEVLITTGIIGIMAALIIPGLVRNTVNREIMTNLSSTVTNLENAFTRAIEEEHADDLTETTLGNFGNRAVFIGNLKRYYTKISGFQGTNGAAYYRNHNTVLRFMNNDGTVNNNRLYGNVAGEWTIELAGGQVVFISPFNDTPEDYPDPNEQDNGGNDRYPDGLDDPNYKKDVEAWAFNRGTVLRDIVAEFVIDANGDRNPNVVGRDVFKFYLASDGKLYPHGSREYSNFLNEGDHIWTNADDDEGFSCMAGSLANTWGCSARVVEEGYVINY